MSINHPLWVLVQYALFKCKHEGTYSGGSLGYQCIFHTWSNCTSDLRCHLLSAQLQLVILVHGGGPGVLLRFPRRLALNGPIDAGRVGGPQVEQAIR